MPQNKLLTASSDWYYFWVKLGIITKGHYLLSHGLHTKWYANLMLILARYPKIVAEIIGKLWKILNTFHCGRQKGIVSVGIGSLFASHLSLRAAKQGWGKHACIIARRNSWSGHLYFDRDQHQLVKGRTFVLTDDVFTTGETLIELGELILRHGGKIAGCLVVLNRSKISAVRIGKQTHNILAAYHRYIETYERMSCPACHEKIPFSTTVEEGKHEFHRHGQLIPDR